jgi:hypothetical protein
MGGENSGPDDAPGREPPRVSIILPHLNTPDLLVRALQSLIVQRIDHGWFEIIVVDNGSRMSLAPVAEAWPMVRFLSCHEPGPGPARNHGIAAARADVLAFIDADVRVLPGWLQAGLDALQSAPGPVGGDVRIDTADPHRLSGVEAFECVFAFRQQFYIARRQFSVTANLIMTRAMFDAAGPFGGIDTNEDIHFGERAHALGIPTSYAPTMRALHPPRASFDEMRRKWQRLSVQLLGAHLDRGGSFFAWKIKALAVALSGVGHLPMMFVSPRVSGPGNRVRGAGFLLRIRIVRALDMLRQAREARRGASTQAFNWNR